jgi:hypothetical protein
MAEVTSPQHGSNSHGWTVPGKQYRMPAPKLEGAMAIGAILEEDREQNEWHLLILRRATDDGILVCPSALLADDHFSRQN